MFKLYCSWGIDFIKLDGTSSGRTNETSYLAISAYRAAIDKHCGGREVVLSLSAGGPGVPGWPDPEGWACILNLTLSLDHSPNNLGPDAIASQISPLFSNRHTSDR